MYFTKVVGNDTSYCYNFYLFLRNPYIKGDKGKNHQDGSFVIYLNRYTEVAFLPVMKYVFMSEIYINSIIF